MLHIITWLTSHQHWHSFQHECVNFSYQTRWTSTKQTHVFDERYACDLWTVFIDISFSLVYIPIHGNPCKKNKERMELIRWSSSEIVALRICSVVCVRVFIYIYILTDTFAHVSICACKGCWDGVGSVCYTFAGMFAHVSICARTVLVLTCCLCVCVTLLVEWKCVCVCHFAVLVCAQEHEPFCPPPTPAQD